MCAEKENCDGLKSAFEKMKRLNTDLKAQLKTANEDNARLKAAFDALSMAVALRNGGEC